MALREALRRLIAQEATLTAGLASYEFTTGEPTPAIFAEQAPPDAVFPCVLLRELGGEAWGTRGRRGGVFRVEATVYLERATNCALADELSDRLWRLLNRAGLNEWLEGYENLLCQAEPPAPVTDRDGYPGRRVMVRAWLLERED